MEQPRLSHVGAQGRYISGSGQFTEANILQLSEKVSQVTSEFDKIIVIDTRIESHGFINGLPVEWKLPNLGKSAEEILADEKLRLLEIFQDKVINDIEVHSVSTEMEVIAALHGFEYVRLPTLNQSRPSDSTVDLFLDIIKNNPQSWLHIHCHVGKGRTTVFMVMYDMFYNAKDLEFEEILERNKAIDGQDLEKHKDETDLNPDKRSLYEERLEFVKRFYQYCREADPQNISWQDWFQNQ